MDFKNGAYVWKCRVHHFIMVYTVTKGVALIIVGKVYLLSFLFSQKYVLNINNAEGIQFCD
jgi:hypothetical protein